VPEEKKTSTEPQNNEDFKKNLAALIGKTKPPKKQAPPEPEKEKKRFSLFNDDD
jgi:hypothetical protein